MHSPSFGTLHPPMHARECSPSTLNTSNISCWSNIPPPQRHSSSLPTRPSASCGVIECEKKMMPACYSKFRPHGAHTVFVRSRRRINRNRTPELIRFQNVQCTYNGPGDGRTVTHNVDNSDCAKSLCLGMSALCTISVMLVVATRLRATRS